MTSLFARVAAAVAALFLVLPAAAPLAGQVPYRILITNDDGVYSPGIAALAQVASRFGEVRIVAPDVEMSSASHSISGASSASVGDTFFITSPSPSPSLYFLGGYHYIPIIPAPITIKS